MTSSVLLISVEVQELMTVLVQCQFDFEKDVAYTTCCVSPGLTVAGDSLRVIFPHVLAFREASSDPYFCKTDSCPGPPDEMSGPLLPVWVHSALLPPVGAQ